MKLNDVRTKSLEEVIKDCNVTNVQYITVQEKDKDHSRESAGDIRKIIVEYTPQ